MTVRDKEFNKFHCQNCHADCGDCQDSFENGYVTEYQGFFKPRKKTKAKIIWRYAQRKTMDSLVELFTKGNLEVAK